MAESDSKVMIGVQCIFHKVIQSLIAELRPEAGLNLFRGVRRCLGAHKAGGYRGLWFHIIGADGAGRKGGGYGGGYRR